MVDPVPLSDVEKAEADELFARVIEEQEAETQKRIVAQVPMRYQPYYLEKYPPPAEPPAEPPA